MNKKNLWFRDIDEEMLFINEHVMRARSGMLFMIPLFLAFSFFYYNSIFTTQWIVDASTATSDFMDTTDDGQQIYAVEAIKRTYDYWLQTTVLCYALFEMIVSLSKHTVKFSPTVWIGVYFTRNKKPYYAPYAPKKFAWSMGAIIVSFCIIFFNPSLIPIEGFLIPLWAGMIFLSMCFSFMWLEVVFAFCVGCWIHSICAKLGIVKNDCYECNNLDF